MARFARIDLQIHAESFQGSLFCESRFQGAKNCESQVFGGIRANRSHVTLKTGFFLRVDSRESPGCASRIARMRVANRRAI